MSNVSTLAIDINDAELVVADHTGVLAQEPGYAALVLKDDSIVTGVEAYAQARLNPRQTSNRYWNDLSIEPGSAGIDSIESSAELAFTQLDSLWKRFGGSKKNAILVVPGYYTREQLGLLLGLAQECKMPVRAMIDAGVAASTRPYPGHQLIHVDTGLHRVSATRLEQGDDVAAEPEQALNGVGLASLTDLWAKRVAEIFVLQTRFDPFHRADSEQLVYDRLPEWITTLQDEDHIELMLPYGGEEHYVEVQRDQLLGVADGFYRALVQLISQCRTAGASLVVELSHRLLRLPGIVHELMRLDDANVIPMAPGAAALGALSSLESIELSSGQIKLLRRLPWRGEAIQLDPIEPEQTLSVTGDPEALVPEPTHVVYRGVAYAIDGSSLFIGREVLDGRHTIVLDERQSAVSRAHCEVVRRDGEIKLMDLSRFGTFVNEKRVSGEVDLHPADIIRIGSPGEELQIIALEDRDGS